MGLYGSELELDLENVSEEGYSVEDILAEFHSDSGADTPAIDRQEKETRRARQSESPRRGGERRPSGRREKERERRREPEAAGEPSEEPSFSQSAPAAEREPAPELSEPTIIAPAVAPAASSWTFEEKRSSLPSEEEIRAFMAEYAAEEAAAPEREEAPRYPGEPEFDERFHVDSKRRRGSGVRYAGRHIDQSADAKYTPHAASEYMSSYTPDAAEESEEDERPDEKPALGFLGRIRETLGRERQQAREKELARREAARKIRYPETQELTLPEDEAAEAAAPEAPEAPDLDEILREEKTHAWYSGETLTPPEEPAAPPQAPAAPVPAEEEEDEPERAPKRARPVAVRPEKKKRSAEPEEDEMKPAWSRTAASRKEYAVVFPDTSASPAVYAAQPEDFGEDEAEEAEENEGDALKDQDFFPASFKEYIFSLLTSFLYRLRGGARGTMTMDDEDEDLGDEVQPAFASRYYGGHIRSMRLRLHLCLAVLAVMLWISLGLPVTGQLNNISVACFLCLAMQLVIMLLCLDVGTGAVLNGVRGRPGLDTMAVLACFVTSVDAIFAGLDGFSAPHMPLCVLSSASLTGVLAASLFSCRALRKAMRVPAIARRSYTVTGENNVKNGEITLLKSVRPVKGFVRRAEEAAPDETFFRKLCLPTLALVLLLALAAAAIKRNIHDFFYILSVLLCPAVPFVGLMSFAMPYFTGSMRLFPSGAAVAGWSGVSDIGLSKNLIVTDRDIFPDGSVEIDTVRIFADADPVTIISYAGSMLTACGSSVSSCFGELMKKNGGRMHRIENFEYLPGGGMRGVIDSRVILCGSTDLMQLMNVRIPYRLVKRTSVLLAVDGLLYGIFNMKYDPQPSVRSALIGLMRSGRHPVFAIRDFNITPSMLHDSFGIATDGYDFPPYVERFAMSEAAPGLDSKVAAVVCRDGLGPLSDTADIGRSVYVAARANLIITALGMLAGIVTSFVHLLRFGGVGIPFLFFFMLMWAIPVYLVGRILRLER